MAHLDDTVITVLENGCIMDLATGKIYQHPQQLMIEYGHGADPLAWLELSLADGTDRTLGDMFAEAGITPQPYVPDA